MLLAVLLPLLELKKYNVKNYLVYYKKAKCCYIWLIFFAIGFVVKQQNSQYCIDDSVLNICVNNSLQPNKIGPIRPIVGPKKTKVVAIMYRICMELIFL